MSISTKILVGLVLGIFVGLGFGAEGAKTADLWIAPFGAAFLGLIRMIIVPLVLSSLVVGAASVGDIRKVGRMGGKTFALYLLTTAVAIALGLILGTISQPGVGISMATAKAAAVTASPSIVTVILGLIPSNPMEALLKGDMLKIIVFALFLGIGSVAVGEKAKPLVNFFDAVS